MNFWELALKGFIKENQSIISKKTTYSLCLNRFMDFRLKSGKNLCYLCYLCDKEPAPAKDKSIARSMRYLIKIYKI